MKYLHLGVPMLAAVFLIVSLGQVSRAQGLSIGIKGGFQLNNDMKSVSGGDSESKAFKFGPAIEFQLTPKAGIEVSALYRRVGYRSVFVYAPYFSDRDRIRSNSWEFPILGKYYLSGGKSSLRTFISGGFVLTRFSEAKGISEELSYPDYRLIKMQKDVTLNSNPAKGLTVGGGIHFGLGRIRFSPEFRYTRWITVPFDVSGSRGYQVTSSRNGLDFLLDLSFVALRRHKGD